MQVTEDKPETLAPWSVKYTELGRLSVAMGVDSSGRAGTNMSELWPCFFTLVALDGEGSEKK